MNESEQSNTILSNNRIGNHNVFAALIPVITAWGGFAILILFIGMLTFFLTDRQGFLLFMPQVFIWAIRIVGVAITLLLASFAVRYILGAFITHIVEPLRHNRVVYGNENFMAYTGDVKVSHHDDARYSYNIKQVEGNQVAGLLPTPVEKPIPTGRQLIEDGTVERIVSRGEIILGFLEDGTMKTLSYDMLYSTDLGGIGGSGKTTTAYWLCVQEILAGTKLIVVDPHLHVRRRGIAQGLGQLLSPFKTSYLFAPCADDPEHIMKRARWMRDENKRRQGPGVNLDREPQVMMVIDEFNSIIAIEEIKQELGDIIATVQREGRKLGLFFLLVGHRWSQQDIGNIKIRTNAATVMAHYYNDADQADKLLGGSGRLCQQLKAGSYWLRGLMTGDLCKVRTPMMYEADSTLILDLLGHLTPYPTGPTIDAASGDTYRHTDELGDTSGDTYRQPVEPMEVTTSVTLTQAQRVKMMMVVEMDIRQASQNEIIAAVWNVNPKDRAGQEAARELRLIRAYMAEQRLSKQEA